MIELTKKYLKIDFENFKKEDVKILQEIIKFHSDLYYNKEKPIISDFEYDILLKKLQLLEEKFQISEKIWDSVWAEILESTFEKVSHSRPMISLDNTYDEEDLRDFDWRVKKNLSIKNIFPEKIFYNLEFKFDWLWIELIYKSWELVQAITRWNWIIWEDVTQNIFQISNIPKKINYKSHLEVRWEVIMPISSFENLNKKAKEDWKKIFSNPRNAASWSVRMKDISETKKRNLKFFAYDLANFSDFINEKNIKKYSEVIFSLQDLWFEISSYFKKFYWIEEVIKAIENFWDEKNKIDFDIDGLVLKVDDIEFWEKIGWTEHHPKYAIAYKFPAEIMTTKLLSVEHSVWRTWTITPVANLEPINMSWVLVKRATLHNYEEVEKLWLKIWDYVFIKRAWEVIPKIISVAKSYDKENEENKIFPPEFCPSCGEKILKDEDKVRFYCGNTFFCPAQQSEKIIFWVWKQWLNIDWLGEKQIELFLELWLINSLSSIFDLKNKKDEIIFLEWFWEKSFENLVNSLEKAKNIDLERFITSLWISWVWKKTAKTLKKIFKSKQDFLDFSFVEEDFSNLKDIWDLMAKNIVSYFNDENNKKVVSELLEILNIKFDLEEKIEKNSIFSWKKVCITWNFEKNWQKISRDSLIEILEKNWWEFVWSVSKNTDFLLVWEKAWSKLKKAETLSIKIIDLDFFMENTKI